MQILCDENKLNRPFYFKYSWRSNKQNKAGPGQVSGPTVNWIIVVYHKVGLIFVVLAIIYIINNNFVHQLRKKKQEQSDDHRF